MVLMLFCAVHSMIMDLLMIAALLIKFVIVYLKQPIIMDIIGVMIYVLLILVGVANMDYETIIRTEKNVIFQEHLLLKIFMIRLILKVFKN